jgi:hypothetical protein
MSGYSTLMMMKIVTMENEDEGDGKDDKGDDDIGDLMSSLCRRSSLSVELFIND